MTVYKLRDKAGQIEFALDGEGTYEDPYRIENAADLLHFAELVSDGMTFKGQYVEQIADIDLDGKNMQPIGDVENEHCFYGVYNGAGHVIRNLNLKQSNSENVGLFSCLGGQVYNLGLEGGTIRGKYAGAIAGGSVGKRLRWPNLQLCQRGNADGPAECCGHQRQRECLGRRNLPATGQRKERL